MYIPEIMIAYLSECTNMTDKKHSRRLVRLILTLIKMNKATAKLTLSGCKYPIRFLAYICIIVDDCFRFIWLTDEHLSSINEPLYDKTNNVVSAQVRHKPSCINAKDG